MRAQGAAMMVALAALVLAPAAQAGPREEAKRMHDRLVGVPPDNPTLDAMETMVGNQDYRGAALLAMQNPAFYNVTLKNFVTPWTNEEMTVFAPLNDYTATVIGMIRDDHPFNEVLSADLVYVGQGIQPGYSQTDNDHYQTMDDNLVDLSTALVPRTQSGLPGSMLTEAETGGVVTTRQAGMAFFDAGTNRAMFRFTAINYLCRDMEELNDTSRAVDRIRQDVSRSPGGDSQIFLNSCSGCHSGMDPLSGAYAYFNWDENLQRVLYTRGQVQAKNLLNSNTFPFGYVTIDDRWDNYWRNGQNAVLGWRGDTSGGYGVKSMGAELTASRAFSTCMVERVFENVCFREPSNLAERTKVEEIADDFENEGYRMKLVFADVATYCRADQ